MENFKNKYTNFTLAEFCKVIGAELPKDIDENTTCGRVLTQSDYVKPGDLVISAGWYNHNRIVSESLEKGALAVFCNIETKKTFSESNVVAVNDPLLCVQKFEQWRSEMCNAKKIAITGSVGKTTTTGLINKVVESKYKTLTHHSMSNSHGAILRHYQQLTPEHEYWVQEIGGVQPGYIESSAKVLNPDIAVLTTIGESHLDTYKTQENILSDKTSIERYLKDDGAVIINKDNKMLDSCKFTHKTITISFYDETADYYVTDYKQTVEGMTFSFKHNNETYTGKISLYGDYNIYNALSAVAVGNLIGLSMEESLNAISTYKPSGMRQNFKVIGGHKMLIDCFNAEPLSVLGSAKTLTKMEIEDGGRKIFVTGHIDKLGEKSAQMHTQLGNDLSSLDIDLILLYGQDSIYIHEALKQNNCKNSILFKTRQELDAWLSSNITSKDITFYKSGQFETALAKTIDNVYGTKLQNEQQANEGYVVEENGFSFRIRKDNVAELISYSGNEKHVTIPSKCNNIPVVRIQNRAFRRNLNLESITMPDTITYIGEEAFYICVNLEKVNLSKSLKYIDKNAFNYCKKLSKIELPEGVLHVDRHGFYDCVSLKEILIPDTVGYFGKDVFHNCPNLNILCSTDSFTYKYAKELGLSVKEHVYRPNDIKRVAQVNAARSTKINKCKWIFDYVKKEIGCEEAELTKEEIAQIRDTWGPLYDAGIISPRWAALYKDKHGEFKPDYVGNDLHIYYVEDQLVDKGYIRGLCDKNIMPLVTPAIKHPKTLFSKLNGIYIDENYDRVDEEKVIELIYENRAKEAVIKQCRSSGGKGVDFINENSTKEDIRSALTRTPYVTVQDVVKQHKDMAAMNPSSVNTIRIMTVLINGEANVVASIVRMGSEGSKVDNFHSGGISCTINPDGTLKDFGCDVKGTKFKSHSNGFVFEGAKVPSYDKACEAVKKLHYSLPVFGLISWDICIDEEGEPILIEYNIGGGITVYQLSNGPLYGEYRQQIVDEAFKNYEEKRACLDFSYMWKLSGGTVTEGSTDAKRITIPKTIDGISLTSVAKEAFYNRTNIEDVTFNGDLDSLEFSSFCKCYNLKTVTFNGTVKTIGRSAFNSCINLKSIKLPVGTEEIGRYAFAYNSSLETIFIPDTVTDIAEDAFYKAPNVRIVCKKDSYAEHFAIKNKIKYSTIQD